MVAAALREAEWPAVPAETRARFEADESTGVQGSLRQLSLLRRMIELANDRQLRIVVLKGVALSMRLYGNPLVREAYDLDLLVHHDDLGKLVEILGRLGFQRAIGGPLTPRQEALLTKYSQGQKFRHDASGVVVDCHRVLDRNPHLISADFDGIWQRRGTVQLGDFSAAILGDRDLVPYLAVHAARHAWERWKWVGDLSALFRSMPDSEALVLCADAERTGLLSLLHCAVLLVRTIAGTATPAALAAGAAGDARARRLAERALRLSLPRRKPAAIHQPSYKARLMLYRWGLRRGARFLAFEMIAALYQDRDWHAWRLPDWAIPIYFLLRPLSFLWRHLPFSIRS